MNELLAGGLSGLGLAILSWLLVRPAVGRDPLSMMARLVSAFLLKLALVTGALIVLSRFMAHEKLVRFALVLLAVLLLASLLQVLVWVLILKRKTGTDS